MADFGCDLGGAADTIQDPGGARRVETGMGKKS